MISSPLIRSTSGPAPRSPSASQLTVSGTIEGRKIDGTAHLATRGEQRVLEGLRVAVGDKPYAIEIDWRMGGIRATGRCNGKPFTAQIERDGLWTVVQHNGRRIDAMVMSARAAELLRAMPYKPPADMSKFLLSPMPGLLVDIVVAPGKAVQAGEKLAVIEAMKMENILVAARDGVVAELLASKGESLAVDQPILSFE